MDDEINQESDKLLRAKLLNKIISALHEGSKLPVKPGKKLQDASAAQAILDKANKKPANSWLDTLELGTGTGADHSADWMR